MLTVREADVDAVLAKAEAAGVFCPWIGRTGGESLKLGAARPVAVKALKAAHEGWFPSFMDGKSDGKAA